MQNKKLSLIETITQTFIGLATSILIQFVLYPIMNIPVTFNQNCIITIVFFVVSILRGFLIRRLFNSFKDA